MLDPATLARVRGEVSITRVHFNHAGMSPTPAPVLDRMLAHLRREAEIGGYEAAVEAGDELDAVPGVLARLIGARPHELAVTDSATRAWEVALWSLAETFGWGPGDRVVVDQFAYGSVHAALAALHHGRGVGLHVVAAGPDGRVEPGAVAAAVDERTRVVVATHVPTHVGTVTDVAAIGRAVLGSGAVFAVDVSQSLGQLPVDVAAIGCAMAFAPGRKFLRAPRGTAVLYVAEDLADQLVPLTLPFGVVDPADPSHFTQPPGLRRLDQFESGTAATLALAEAARYALALGLDAIAATVAERSRAVIDVVDGVSGLRRTGGDDDRGIISFVHPRLEPAAVVDGLAAAGVNAWVNPVGGAPFDAVHRPVLPAVRLSPHYLTSDDELDRLDQALRTLE